MNSKQLRKQTKQRIKDLGINKRNIYINVTCTICGKNLHIHVNDIKVYTDEIISNYRCLDCK